MVQNTKFSAMLQTNYMKRRKLNFHSYFRTPGGLIQPIPKNPSISRSHVQSITCSTHPRQPERLSLEVKSIKFDLLTYIAKPCRTGSLKVTSHYSVSDHLTRKQNDSCSVDWGVTDQPINTSLISENDSAESLALTPYNTSNQQLIKS